MTARRMALGDGPTALDSLVLSLRADVSVAVSKHSPSPSRPAHQEYTVVFESADVRITLGGVTSALLDAIRVLRSAGAPRDRLLDSVVADDGHGAAAGLERYLKAFDESSLLRYTLLCRGRPLLTYSPITTHHRGPAAAGVGDRRFVLSRFAFLRRIGGSLVLESPLSHARIELHDAGAAGLVGGLALPLSATELLGLYPALDEATARAVLELLAGADMLTEVVAGEEPRGDGDDRQGHWEFHDLLFHSRSRLGRHGNPYGRVAVQPLLSMNDVVEPVVKPTMSRKHASLPTPDVERFLRNDPPFGLVAETRTSIRCFGTPALTEAQLGEFLYRIARVKRIVQTEWGKLSARPYPSGGGCYELELYLDVNECRDLEPGLYHYEPLEHRLGQLSASANHRQALLRGAAQAMNADVLPQILIVITARVRRVSSQYRSMAYAMTLKHVGVLFQTMYLTATAMNLAGCAIGGGNSDLFASASGVDYYVEPSVGEFALGSRPAHP